jgi:5-methylcytosine-specific restriction enzyme A
MAPLHECRHPGCHILTDKSQCPNHTKQDAREVDSRRGSPASRGYDARWNKERKAFLRANPLCAICEANGDTIAAMEVDHIKPHKGNKALFWDQNNWQSLCNHCHSRKTALEDGRWA